MLIPHTSGERHLVLGSTATIKLSGQRLAVVEHEMGRDAGPPAHIHRGEDELLYVRSGSFDVLLGEPGQWRTAEQGTWIHVPAGTLHTTRCTGERGHLLSIYSPGGGEAFFRDVGGIDQADLAAVAELAERHGITVPA